jgi:hypothetical protein
VVVLAERIAASTTASSSRVAPGRLDGLAAGNEPNEDDCHCQDEQEVNESRSDVQREAEQPHHCE